MVANSEVIIKSLVVVVLHPCKYPVLTMWNRRPESRLTVIYRIRLKPGQFGVESGQLSHVKSTIRVAKRILELPGA